MSENDQFQIEEGALAALKGMWNKMKSDFSTGYTAGQKFSNWLFRKKSPHWGKVQEPPAKSKEEPKKKDKKKRKKSAPKAAKEKPAAAPAASDDGGSKEKVKKFKGAKKAQGKFKKSPAEKFKKAKKGCGPAPKKKDKIRCPKPGGGHTYYNKGEFGKKHGGKSEK